MARPKVSIDKRRSLNVVKVYLTVEEKEAIKIKANTLGVSMSELLISSSLGYKLSSFDSETKMLVHELLKIGNNVNQITRQLNAIVRDGRQGELKKFEFYDNEFKDMRFVIDEILNKLKK